MPTDTPTERKTMRRCSPAGCPLCRAAGEMGWDVAEPCDSPEPELTDAAD